MQKVRQESLVSRINDVLATRITFLVGSIWAFYAFVIFGLKPVRWPDYEPAILYWSNFLQLIFLPIITVGTAILNRDSDARAMEDHKNIRKEFDLMREIHAGATKSLQEIHAGVSELLSRSAPAGAEPARLGRERKGHRPGRFSGSRSGGGAPRGAPG